MVHPHEPKKERRKGRKKNGLKMCTVKGKKEEKEHIEYYPGLKDRNLYGKATWTLRERERARARARPRL